MKAEIIEKKEIHNKEKLKRHQSFYKMVFGVTKELNIIPSELSNILKVSKQTVSDWSSKKAIPFNNERLQDEINILHFIELYNRLLSYFLNIKDVTEWLREENIIFDNKSPIVYMMNEDYGLRDVVSYLSQRMNP